MKSSKAYAPASISNLNCGFDTLGMAIDGLGDEVEICSYEGNENVISEIINGEGLSLDLKSNTAGLVVDDMISTSGYNGKVSIKITKGYKYGSGLGSSAASAAAAAVACNHFLGNPFKREDLLHFAMRGEYVASKSIHGDNIFPSLLGGAVLVRSVDPISYVQLPIPKELTMIIIFPQFKVNTSEARGILSDTVPLKKAASQWANLGSLVASFYRSDFDLMEKSMVDEVIEEQRVHLIPGFHELKELALKSGAISFGISGSGPSMFVFAEGVLSADSIMKVLKKRSTQLYNDVTVSVHQIDRIGTRVLE